MMRIEVALHFPRENLLLQRVRSDSGFLQNRFHIWSFGRIRMQHTFDDLVEGRTVLVQVWYVAVA